MWSVIKRQLAHFGGPIYVAPRLALAVARKCSTLFVTFICSLAFKRISPGSRVQWGAHFHDPSVVDLGSDCLVWRGVATTSDGTAAALVIGDRVHINIGVHLDHSAELVIGNDTVISEHAFIYTHDHGLDPHSDPQKLAKSIGSNVWIGMRSVVLASCQRIGSGAIIGAASVVTRDVPDGAIVAGVPARIIGWRDQKNADPPNYRA